MIQSDKYNYHNRKNNFAILQLKGLLFMSNVRKNRLKSNYSSELLVEIEKDFSINNFC